MRILTVLMAATTLLPATAEAGRKDHCRPTRCKPAYCQPSYCQPSYCQPSYCQPSYCQPGFPCMDSGCAACAPAYSYGEQSSQAVRVGDVSSDVLAELTSINLRLGQIRKQLIGKDNPNEQQIDPNTLKQDIEDIKAKLP